VERSRYRSGELSSTVAEDATIEEQLRPNRESFISLMITTENLKLSLYQALC